MAPKKSLQALHTRHLQCRSWYHAWDYSVSYLIKYDRVECIELHIVCDRCTATRIDTIKRRDGMLMTRKYVMPDGYIIKDLKAWGGRSIFNANARLELVSRYVNVSERKE